MVSLLLLPQVWALLEGSVDAENRASDEVGWRRSGCWTGWGEGLRVGVFVSAPDAGGGRFSAILSFWRESSALFHRTLKRAGHQLTFRVFSLNPKRLKCSASSVGLGIPGKLGCQQVPDLLSGILAERTF